MSNELEPKPESLVYQIRIQGQLDARWANWFDEMTIAVEDAGDTLLTGEVIDQAALYGLIKKVRDLGVTLIAVNRVEPRPVSNPETKSTEANR